MKLSIPIALHADREGKSYHASPLFVPEVFQIQAPLLEKVLVQSRQFLRQYFDKQRQQPGLEAYRHLSFSPTLKEVPLALNLEFERRTVPLRLLFVRFTALGRKLVYTPSLNGLWFVLEAERSLEEQAYTAVRQALRKLRKAGWQGAPEDFGVGERSWVHWIELEVDPPGVSEPPKQKSLLALLGGAEVGDGADELAQCARELERPDQDPEPFLGRERELEELAQWRASPQRSGMLLVGPHLVGKSALVRAHVARRRGGRKSRTYLLSPGRLISGMSYLGQWENRFLNILKHCRERDHVLVFDDLLGLLTAGVSRDSSLNAAQILKSFLDRGEVRVLAEISPEALQILRQRDRALAGHFQVLPVTPSPIPLTRQVALAAARSVEKTQECQLSLEAIHRALEIGDRYLSDASHPGKVARLLQQIGAHYRKREVGESQVLDWFSEHSGMSAGLLSGSVTLRSADVAESIREQLVGQDEAVRHCAELVALTKSRLQSPDRPLGSLLLIGPTGVGKTECAKTLARVLFGKLDRLIRIDLNEYLGADSIDRLIGTFDKPEGVLTEAVRSQPFSVVLLDEFEKAHPQVLLLLLQILGDGRLSDARGRTVDFSQTLVVMTSNLGADQVQSSLGLRSRVQQEELVYRKAAEEFFPPELFNRIDRIVPFRRLSRPVMARIADKLWQQLLEREGLRRRHCLLEIDPQARERVVDAGFHPLLGARALKRTIEEKVVAPVARRLSAMPPEGLTRIHVGEELEVDVDRVEAAPSLGFVLQPVTRTDLHARIDALSLRLKEGRSGEVSVYTQDSLSESEMAYFELEEELRRVRDALKPGPRGKANPSLPLRQLGAAELSEATTSLELPGLLEGWLSGDTSLEWAAEQLRLHWLEKRLSQTDDECEASLRLSGHAASLKALVKGYQESLASAELECRVMAGAIELSGPGAGRVAAGECGLHLFVDGGALHTVWVRRDRQPSRLVRIYLGKRAALDMASGILCAKGWGLASVVLTR